MAVQPDTAHELVDELFLFGRALRLAIVASHTDPLPQALVGVLVVLAARGECRQNELATELCITPSSLSRQISDLVDAGYIGRHADPCDGRASLVHVTDAGKALLLRSKEVRSARLRETLAEWDETDAQSALESVRKLKNTMFDHASRQHAMQVHA
ncbi:MarR family winged helix-turn-helix transcriptional regulator [Antrihabitans cavernicola]|uniref:Winged helix-turn-helix transcriptional regulator n=1 Tax=Antrihabitans cavernicola TaxID=2495913 RepID=A0A5A7SK56_9NOCA|nr:MarR family winged helix-turn-helix transcriptional regulator [Spelaeibacter cavernicola]KAA0024581.1 winged helix-turn-helix transcriptional regulator [Spelaeibacter cavernicola]